MSNRLWIPKSATDDQRDVQEHMIASYAEQAQTLETFRYWNGRLKSIDERLELIKAPENCDLPGIRPGFWHVLRVVPGAVPGVVVHEGPNGEFMEPNSYLFERLESSDLWDDRVRRDHENRKKDLQKEAERERERERNERLEELKDRYRHKYVPKIAVSRDI